MPTTDQRKPGALHRWIRLGFLSWAVISTLWMADSYRTRGVDDRMLRSSPTLTFEEDPMTVALLPVASRNDAALIFICGAGVSAHAYLPLLRPIAETGYSVFVVKLPYRFAPLESHKQTAVNRALGVVTAHPDISRWVISGHSLGGALACRVIQTAPAVFASMVLIGTTHPKQADLSSLSVPVTKVYASNDGVAPADRVLSNKTLLPIHTKWVEIQGGNHSQFGHYGHQLFDGAATIGREAQQEITRAALIEALAGDH